MSVTTSLLSISTLFNIIIILYMYIQGSRFGKIFISRLATGISFFGHQLATEIFFLVTSAIFLVAINTYKYLERPLASFIDPSAAIWAALVCGWMGAKFSSILAWPPGLLRGLKFKVPETPIWYFTDDLSNLLSVLFLVLLRLLMCWMSWCHFFLCFKLHLVQDIAIIFPQLAKLWFFWKKVIFRYA